MNEIAKLPKASIDEIKHTLFYCIKLIGVNPEKLVKEDLDLIIDYIKRNFKRLSTADIRLAFEIGVKGELDFDLQHYQSFNTMYVANVLLSYKRYCADQNRRNKEIQTKPLKELTFNELEDHGKKALMAHKDEEDLSDFRWSELYFYYKKKGFISFNTTEINRFQEQVREDLKAEMKQRSDDGKSNKVYSLLLESKALFQCECRKRAVLKYFETLK